MLLQYCKFIHKTQTFDSHFTLNHLYILRFDSDAYAGYRRSSQGNHFRLLSIIHLMVNIYLDQRILESSLKISPVQCLSKQEPRKILFFFSPKVIPIMTIYKIQYDFQGISYQIKDCFSQLSYQTVQKLISSSFLNCT